jgi:hypothetical protein
MACVRWVANDGFTQVHAESHRQPVDHQLRGKALTAQPPTTPILPAWPLYLPESRGGGMSLESASRSRVSAVMEVVTKRRGRSAGLEVEDEGWRVEPTRVPMRSG